MPSDLPARVLVVEDEPLLRRQLCASLRELWPEIGAIDEAASGAEAVRLLGASPPDIAFLDINLPDMSGMDLAALLRDKAHVVFVTAYSEHAVTAFEQHALDYVLKPATTRRLADTVTRLRQIVAQRQGAQPAGGATSSDLPAREELRWISAGSGNTTELIPLDEVLAFNADDKYTEVISKTSEWLIRKPIRELLEELPSADFWQIHRATIVRVGAIERIVRGENGNLDVRLKGCARSFAVSRNFAYRFRQM